jgi:hypothetical protein
VYMATVTSKLTKVHCAWNSFMGGVTSCRRIPQVEPRVVMSEVRLAAKIRHLREAAESSSGRAPSWHVIRCHSPYNMRKKPR